MPPPHKEINKFSDNLKKAFAKSFCTTNRTTAEEWGTVLFNEISHLQELITKAANKTTTEVKIEQLLKSSTIYHNNEYRTNDHPEKANIKVELKVNDKPVKFTPGFTMAIINIIITSTVFMIGMTLNSGPLIAAGLFIGLIFGFFLSGTKEDDL